MRPINIGCFVKYLKFWNFKSIQGQHFIKKWARKTWIQMELYDTYAKNDEYYALDRRVITSS